MLFDELEQLADLIPFGLAADVLQVHQLRHTGAGKDIMTAARADVVKAKGFRQLQCLRKPEVRRALQSLAEQLAGIHMSAIRNTTHRHKFFLALKPEASRASSILERFAAPATFPSRADDSLVPKLRFGTH